MAGSVGDRNGLGHRRAGLAEPPGRFRPDTSGAHQRAPAARVQENLTALQVLRRLQQERRDATAAEREVLSLWSGWGAVPDVFDQSSPSLAGLRTQLQDILTGEEWTAASRSTLNAHYTDPRVADAMWTAVQALGFSTGRVLEPGCGAGAFLGLAPSGCDLVGVELEPTTAAIAAALYPHADVRAESFALTRLPESFVDLTIGNVPFGDVTLADSRHNAGRHSIHNHFLIKALHLTRPGGLVAAITSRYTMDALDPGARREMAELGDLVFALRLPAQVHRLASTQVVTDVLVLRRRAAGAAPADVRWDATVDLELPGGVVAVNEYFGEHPEQIVGEMSLGRGMYRDGQLLVASAVAAEAVPEVAGALLRSAHAAAAAGMGLRPGKSAAIPSLAAADLSDGHLVATEDGFARADSGYLVPMSVPRTQHRELAMLLQLRDTYRALIQEEASSVADTTRMGGLRQALNDIYDGYAAAFGPLNRFSWRQGRTDPVTGATTQVRTRPRQGGFRDDPLAGSVYALEHFNPQTQSAGKAEIFRGRVLVPRQAPLRADSPADALAMCLDSYGEVRLDVVSQVLDVPASIARDHLGELVFDDPESGTLVAAPAYLSGNVRQKLRRAQAAAEADDRYRVNVTALNAVLPRDLEPEEIAVRLGGWVRVTHVAQFLRETFAAPRLLVEYVGGTQWTVRGGRGGVLETETWGTPAAPGPKLAEKLLRSEAVQVYLPEVDGKRQLDMEGTEAAVRKAAELNERFGEWVWEDPVRAAELAAEYNERFNAIVLRSYDDTTLSLPGLAHSFRPRPHQLSAAARMIQEPAAGLYHVVGAGKTAEMAMGVMELRRLGLVRKPAIVVPNHLVEQFRNEFLQLYPQAKVLAAGSEDVSRLGRGTFLGRIANNDWDAVIVSRSVFERIPMSVAAQRDYFDRETAQIRTWLESARSQRSMTVKRLEAALARQEEALKRRMEAARDEGLVFEETGIDYLVVDEAHGYKNRRTPSATPDLAIEGSKRATDLDMKLNYLRQTHGHRVATFATGTPIANSMTEAYVMQSYLRPDVLADAGIECFDHWAATFAQQLTEVEVAPTGGYRLKSRIAKFDNVPELLRMFHISADIRTAEELQLPTPGVVGGTPESVQVPATGELLDFMQSVQERAANLSSRAEKGAENVLSLMTEARHGALDLRLVAREPGGESKLDAAADRLMAIWQQHRFDKYLGEDGRPSPTLGALQIVFSDLGTPKEGFNVYDELRTGLSLRGMPPDLVRYVHEAHNDREKAELFAACRRGDVAVLIGSTERMGAGTNIQARAVALHHLDVPWRPADVEQREGRILRQGNQNGSVHIIRWVTERSFDAYMWQTLERKAKFIGQVMRGKLDVREIDDIGEAALSYGEIKALAAGDPLLLEKAQAEADLSRFRRLERAHQRSQDRLKWQLVNLHDQRQGCGAELPVLRSALQRRTASTADNFAMRIGAAHFTKRPDAGQALQRALSELVAQLGARQELIAEVGALAGLSVQVRLRRTSAGLTAGLQLDNLPHTWTEVGKEAQFDPAKATGLVVRLENRSASFEARLADAQSQIHSLTEELERAQSRLGALSRRPPNCIEHRNAWTLSTSNWPPPLRRRPTGWRRKSTSITTTPCLTVCLRGWNRPTRTDECRSTLRQPRAAFHALRPVPRNAQGFRPLRRRSSLGRAPTPAAETSRRSRRTRCGGSDRSPDLTASDLGNAQKLRQKLDLVQGLR